ncbi:MAG: methyl-accepting chemotaxis protein, partial [Janthinobacterium lividum]
VIHADDRSQYDSFRATVSQYLPAQDAVLQASAISKASAVAALLPMTTFWENGRSTLRALIDVNHQHAIEASSSIRAEVRSALIAISVALIVIVIVAFFTGYFLLHAVTGPLDRLVEVLHVMRSGDLSQRLPLQRTDEFGKLEAGFNRMTDELTALVGQAQKSSVQVTTSVAEIAATSREHQATASETAATTTEIGATSREIYATARDLAQTMSEVSGLAEESATLAGTGQSGLTHMEETMQSVMDAAGSVNAKLAILSDKASNINQVISTITKVADQTNLLSLNAAIEAEKAGEYGRGFAVVAIEIRRLADQTAVATYDIEEMVKEMQSAVSAGVMGMDKFSEEVRRGMLEVRHVGAQLSQVIQHVQALAPRFMMVNDGMQTQATNAEQITQALTQLSEAAQQTVESLHQSRQAIDDLTHTANGLRTGVSRFKLVE